MRNIKFNHKTPFFYILFIQTEKYKQTKLLLKFIMLGGETVNHVNFMQHMPLFHKLFMAET